MKALRLQVTGGMHIVHIVGKTRAQDRVAYSGVNREHLLRLPEDTTYVVKFIKPTQAEGPVIHPRLDQLSPELRQRVENLIKTYTGNASTTNDNVKVSEVDLSDAEAEGITWLHGVIHSRPIQEK